MSDNLPEISDQSGGIITAWMPETDQHTLAVLGKMAEEANELAGACARAIIQGIDGVDPATGRTNREEIGREFADVVACFHQFKDRIGVAMDPSRTDQKYAGFDRWHDLIDQVNAEREL